MDEKGLYKKYTMQTLLDDLAIIELYQQPGRAHHLSEITKKQIAPVSYTHLDVYKRQHVDRSIENPEIFLQTNIIGTSVLMDACRKYGIQRLSLIHIFMRREPSKIISILLRNWNSICMSPGRWIS